MPVSKRLRYEILRRDNHACRYCGTRAPNVDLVVDHIIPVALGGTDDPSNLAAACRPCNTGKTSTSPDAPLVADVAQDALRWSRAMSTAAHIQAERQRALDCYLETFEALWDDWTYGPKKEPITKPSGWAESLTRFFELQLGLDVVERFIGLAMRNRRLYDATDIWRYFCGCCWTHLRERQEMAREIFAAEEAGE